MSAPCISPTIIQIGSTDYAITRQLLFWVPGNPECARPRRAANGRMFVTAEQTAWRHDVLTCYRVEAARRGWGVVEYVGHLAMCVRAVNCPQDVDNFGKGVLDSLLGAAYRDDSQVVSLLSQVEGRVLTDKGRPKKPKATAGLWVTVLHLEVA